MNWATACKAPSCVKFCGWFTTSITLSSLVWVFPLMFFFLFCICFQRGQGNCVMVLRYFFLLTLFLVNIIVVPNMHATGWVTTNVECFSQRPFLLQLYPFPMMWWATTLKYSDSGNWSLLAFKAPPPHQCFTFLAFCEANLNSVWEDYQQVLCGILLHHKWLFNVCMMLVFNVLVTLSSRSVLNQT